MRALVDGVILSVGKAAGEDANISCTVSFQPLLINYKEENTWRQ